MRHTVRSGLLVLVIVLAGCSSGAPGPLGPTSGSAQPTAPNDPAAAAAPDPGPSPSDWAGDVWTDRAGHFDISIAKGYTQDPAKGREGDPIALAYFVNSDRSATLSAAVLPARLHGDLQFYVDGYRHQIALHPEYDLLGDAPTTLADGRPAHRFDLSTPDKRMAWFVVGDPTTFALISAWAAPQRWEAEQTALLNMARSFTLSA